MFEHKVTASIGAWTVVGFFLAIPAIVTVTSLGDAHGSGLIGIAMPVAVTVFFAYAAFHLMNLTIRVDNTAVWLRGGDQVPLDKIVSCGVTDRALQGLPRFFNSTRLVTQRGIFYVVPGKQQRLVQLHLESGQFVLFSADDPEAVVDAILERHPQTKHGDDYIPTDDDVDSPL